MTPTVHTITKTFGAALTQRGWQSLPLTEVVVWLGLVLTKRHTQPHKGWSEILGVSALQTVLMLGCEWLHNLAHAAVAQWVGKSADEIRIVFGLPRLIYNELNDTTVTPTQHFARATGGPVLNTLLAGGLWLARRKTATQPHSIAHTLVDSTLKTNVFLATAAWLPVPGLDGGAALKWLLVARGRSVSQADAAVQRVNLLGAPLLALVSGRLLQKRHTVSAVFAALIAASMFVIGMGWISEQSVIEKIDR